MSISETVTLLGIMIALAAMPSSSVALVVTRSATHGVANGIATSVGIVLGDLAFILLAILGLSVVADAMGSLFMVLKYLGASYLLWLGFTLIASKRSENHIIEKPVQKRSLVTSFLAGFILTLGDIKAIIFYASLFPVFIDVSNLNYADISTIILVTVVSVGGVKVIYALSAKRVASLARKYRFENAARNTAGALMVGTGSYLMLKA